MTENTEKNQADDFTLKTVMAFKVFGFGVCKVKNNTDSQIKTAFSDYPYNAIVFSFSAEIENLKNKKTRHKWWPFVFINAQQFYSSTLNPGKAMLFIHGSRKKSAGYLSSDIDNNQASYVYTYTHKNDPHQKAFDRQPVEDERCVI